MKTTIWNKAPVLLILLITLVFAKLQYNKLAAGPGDVCMSICSDGRGYYAWLPALLIYQDVNFNFFEQTEVKDPVCGGRVEGCLQDYRSCIDGTTSNKYYPGASLLMLPFFVVAHVATVLFTDLPATGYSRLYFVLTGISGICYYLLGMWLILLSLRRLGVPVRDQVLTILFVTFGSNIMYFSVDKPSYSHIYSCTEIAGLVFLLLLLRERYTNGRLAALALLTGLIFVTRPVNISVLLLVPFVFWGQKAQIMAVLKAKPMRLLSVLPVVLLPAMLLLINKQATGHYLVYSYGGERFYFGDPYFFELLFSTNNGLFPYTPLMLMPFLLGLLWLRQNAERRLLTGIGVTLLVTVYIHSSWWCWWYGFSFGARSLLDFLPLFAVVTGLSLRAAAGKRRVVLVAAYTVCCVITMLLYHQKNHGYMNGVPIDDYWDALMLRQKG
jgi:hypothetical protein